jgi:DNA-binding transcriptional LysR family regulator
MRELLKSIESLNHLSAFEASARLGSFTNAAKEMGVSQPAISQSVRKLEDAIGTKLFHRRHRNIILTSAGEMLRHDVYQGFDRILQTVKYLQGQHKGRHVTLSVTTAFANYWMIPRLQDFHDQHPNIDLRLQTTDKYLDLAQEDISLAVWRGDGKWDGYGTTSIAKESLMAVASPAWTNSHLAIDKIEDLMSAQLIHLEEPHRNSPTWADFFQNFGLKYHDNGQGLRLNDYALVLHAVMAGQGISLGWKHVTKRMIGADLLTQVGPWEWDSGKEFYLIWSENTELSPDAKSVRDWIIAASHAPSIKPKTTAFR